MWITCLSQTGRPAVQQAPNDRGQAQQHDCHRRRRHLEGADGMNGPCAFGGRRRSSRPRRPRRRPAAAAGGRAAGGPGPGTPPEPRRRKSSRGTRPPSPRRTRATPSPAYSSNRAAIRNRRTHDGGTAPSTRRTAVAALQITHGERRRGTLAVRPSRRLLHEPRDTGDRRRPNSATARSHTRRSCSADASHE